MRLREKEGILGFIVLNIRKNQAPWCTSVRISAMCCTIALDQWANPIQDLKSYHADGQEINSHLVFTTMNNMALGGNHSADRQLVRHRMIGPNYLTQSGLQTEQSDSDQDDVQIVGRDTWPYNPQYKAIQPNDTSPCNATIQAYYYYKAIKYHDKRRYNAIIHDDTRPRYKTMRCHDTMQYNATTQGYTGPQYKAVNGSAKKYSRF